MEPDVIFGLTSPDGFLTISDMSNKAPLSEGNKDLRGVVPITYVQLLYEYLEDNGIPPTSLLGAPMPRAEQGIGRFPVGTWQRYLIQSADALNDPMLGIHLGSRIAPRHLGLLGYVLLACGTVGGAMQRLEQYHKLIYDVNPMRLQTSDKDITLIWGYEAGRPGALVDETAITALIQFCRDIAEQPSLAPNKVSFINPEPANRHAYEHWFNCPVLFNQNETRVSIDSEILAIPLRSADPALIAILLEQADALLQGLPRGGQSELVQRVCTHIVNKMQRGEPLAQDVADALNMSVRTLHRRLAADNSSFRALLQETRHHLAKQYLCDRRLQLTEIAQLLGYSEQSALSRAFKHWQGQTLRQYRRQVLGNDYV